MTSIWIVNSLQSAHVQRQHQGSAAPRAHGCAAAHNKAAQLSDRRHSQGRLSAVRRLSARSEVRLQMFLYTSGRVERPRQHRRACM